MLAVTESDSLLKETRGRAVSHLRDLAAVTLLNLAALGLAVWWLRDPRASAVVVVPPPTRAPGPTATPVKVHVYVSGAVLRPGLVVLSEEARAADAVGAAGGFQPDADRVAVNLAAPLQDGWQLHVPATTDGGGPDQRSPPGAGAGPAGSVGPLTGLGAGGAGADSGGPGAGAGRVNVNTAGAAELETLPGIGPALAERIVAHRAAQGPFASVDDLLAVSGIGEKTLARLRDLVTVR